MDVVAISVAAALLLVGVAAAVARRWRIAITALVVGTYLPLTAYSDDLAAPTQLALVAAWFGVLLAPLTAWALARGRRLVVLAVVAAAVAGPVSILVYDPFYDLECLTLCAHNPLAIWHIDSSALSLLWVGAYVAAATLTAAGVRGPDRGQLLLLAGAAWFIALSPSRTLEAGILTGGLLLAIGGAMVVRAFEARARVADLTRALESAADVETTLRAVAGDPGITVSYLVAHEAGPVDRDGHPSPGAVEGQVTTDIVGPDGVVARVHHDADRADLATLAAALTGPARLAFENGRLAATVRQQAHALAASRRRIVLHADAERRRLEHDLHDGAQQHLLALGLALRGSLDRASEPAERDVLHRCLASTHVTLGEVRELSHGFYPASLQQTGLANALDGVVDRAPVPVSVGLLPERRLPEPVERAVYLLVARAAATARRPLDVTVASSEGWVDVVVAGSDPPDGVLADIFAVLGGTLGVDAGAAGDVPVVRGRLPVTARPLVAAP